MCGQHGFVTYTYLIKRFPPIFNCFTWFILGFCELFEFKIKRINNADLFVHIYQRCQLFITVYIYILGVGID